jgi:6-pyruvoyltetrahydropterin/6-carboxytetrahydropterin synthase
LRNDEWKATLARLYKVKVYETEHNIVEYMGEGELDESDSQLDANLIKLLGADIKC